jgi:hypothetical protein
VNPRVTARLLALVATLAGVGLAAAGCNGSKAPAAAGLGTTGTTSTSAATARGAVSAAEAPIAWAQCMRSHGVPSFNWTPSNSPQFKKAQSECVKVIPADAPPQLVPHEVGPLLAFAKCMRKHGVPSFPDPNSQGHFHQSSLRQSDPYSPLLQTATETCRPLAAEESISRTR